MIRFRQWVFLPSVLLWIFIVNPGVKGSSLRLPNIIGSHMVLQQNTQVNIWGWAIQGSAVEVRTSWDNQSYTTTCDQDGDWLLKINTGPAGGPYEISIISDTTIILDDILLGEVWICSGQSNMEWPLSRAQSAQKEIPRSLLPDIRLFTVERRIASRPKEDVQGKWERCRPQIARGFSAVGYFFGKNIHQQLKIPVGLVNTSWGGTPSQAWTSKEALQDFDDFYGTLAELYKSDNSEIVLAEEKKDSLDLLIKRQSDFLNPENIGFKNGWMLSDFDDSSWQDVKCPAEWSTQSDIGVFEGVAWMRKRFRIP